MIRVSYSYENVKNSRIILFSNNYEDIMCVCSKRFFYLQFLRNCLYWEKSHNELSKVYTRRIVDIIFYQAHNDNRNTLIEKLHM